MLVSRALNKRRPPSTKKPSEKVLGDSCLWEIPLKLKL